MLNSFLLRPPDEAANIEASETDLLERAGFTQDEIRSLLWLRQWYQSGGSDRAPLLRYWEFLRRLVANGKMEP